MTETRSGKPISVSPSMMCCDFLHLEEELALFEDMGIDYLHIDIMDGHYVPNFTLGPGFCNVLAERSNIPLDIHLMIENVDAFIPVFAGYENCVLTFHPEACYHPLRTISFIRDHGARAGIAVDPATSLESVKYLLPDIEFICMMTVNPGYSGGKLVPQVLDKIREFARHFEETGYDIEIEVDGNVSWENIPAMIAAGSETLVVGTSSVFEKGVERRQNIKKLEELIKTC